MKDFVENDHIKFWLEDGILHALYKTDSIWSLQAAKDAVALRLEYTEGKIYSGLAYIPNVRAATWEARQYLASEMGYKAVDKVAIVTHSPTSILLGNLFIVVNKPPRPTRLFKTRAEAVRWLKGI